MKASMMKTVKSNTRVLSVIWIVLASLCGASAGHASVPGIQGTTFNLVASENYTSQPDGMAIYSWGYWVRNHHRSDGSTVWIVRVDANSGADIDRYRGPDGDGNVDEQSRSRGRKHLHRVSRISGLFRRHHIGHLRSADIRQRRAGLVDTRSGARPVGHLHIRGNDSRDARLLQRHAIRSAN